jgi:ribosomal-protein-alanine N-acetyltransferase
VTGSAEVRIRPVRDSDLGRILEIEETAFPNPYPMGYLRFLLRSNPETFLVAENELGIVGYIIADVRHGREGHIISVAVRESERRRGVARRLIEGVTRQFSESGVGMVKLEVRVSNLAAIALYHSMGYRDLDIMSGYYRDGEDALRMMCRIRGEAGIYSDDERRGSMM